MPRNRTNIVTIVLMSAVLLCTDAVAQPGSAVIELAKAESRRVQSTIEFVATLVPSRRATIGSTIDGRVLEFDADAGKPVEAGATLAQLRTATIEIQLGSAEAELRLRQAELEELKNGALPAEIAQAQARLTAAVVDRELADSRLKRAGELVRLSGAISEEQVDMIRSQAARTKQMETEARSALQLLNDGTRKEQIAQAQARFDVQQQAVRLLEDRLKKYTVRTPFAGFVVKEHTESGAWLQQGDPVAEVIAIDPIEIEVFVPQAHVGQLAIGSEMTFYCEASQGQALKAKVKRIIPDADRRARTFPVILQAANPHDSKNSYLLRPGMLVRVALPTSQSRDAVVVPKDAIVLGGPSPMVYLAVDGKAVAQPVKLGIPSDGMIEVTGEIQAGDDVVVKGNERIRPGQPLSTSEQQRER